MSLLLSAIPSLLVTFILFGGGMIFGGVLVLHAFNRYFTSKQNELKAYAKDVLNFYDTTKQLSLAGPRLTRISDITKQQLELSSQIDMPQKSAMHGKYRNQVIGELKKLEEEKHDIFRSLLKDKLDVTISYIDESGKTVAAKLSEYMTKHNIAYTDTVAQESKKVPKLVLYKGGKPEDLEKLDKEDDGSGTTH